MKNFPHYLSLVSIGRAARGVTEGGGGDPPAFHTLVKDMSLNIGATEFTEAMYYNILPIKNIPAPLTQNYPVAPLRVAIGCSENGELIGLYIRTASRILKIFCSSHM